MDAQSKSSILSSASSLTHSHRSGTDDNCCSLFIDADNSALLELIDETTEDDVYGELADDTTVDDVRGELAYRTVSNDNQLY